MTPQFLLKEYIGTFSLLSESYNYWKNLKDKDKKGFKFLLVSTDEVYGSTSSTFTEDSPMRPNGHMLLLHLLIY